MARRVNEYTADLVSARPQRFGNFATVPLPDVEGAVAEIDYALDELQADGIVLLSNYEGIYLGNNRYDPVWDTLDRHHAVVFIHPGHPMMPVLPDVPGPIVDYPFDTTRNAVHMVYNGITTRFPRTRIILSHAGGFVPYAALRFSLARAAFDPHGPTGEELLTQLRSFYFDTALSSGEYAITALGKFAEPSRILFGSDFPYAPRAVATSLTEILDSGSGLAVEQSTAINTTNAIPLFPRLG
ncbi:amidohydrolase [Nocardia sp. MH4]|uniref:amidohydrolase family protein n=1 Tax=Nocardia sp. MH4 TaxID=1768677 RepID=UPI001C4E7BAC|nr:amidohydrolase family protein [Nocardia sp. MH4]MBW0275519.1 amidohydrolase [Nocardia sp. MH4]